MPEIFSSIWQAFTERLPVILPIFLKILKDWWWLPALLIFFHFLKNLYLYFIQERWSKTLNFILLEIKLPKEVEKPMKAMENIFANLWAIYDPPNWKEKWIEGHFLLSFSFEIAGINSTPHFYIRTPKIFKSAVESAIYSQYPEAEIFEVEDYTKNVPQDIPNKDWDLFGTSFKLQKSDVYPIKTYKFFEERPDIKEEKRIDPLSQLLDGIASLKPDEQLWIQIIAKPITIAGKDAEKDLVSEGKKIIDELAKRPKKTPPKPILQEAAEILIFGPPKEKKKEEISLVGPEILLTPGEKEVVKAIEDKISKYAYDCTVRWIYLGKRDVFLKALVRIPFGFFTSFNTVNLNALRVDKNTLTKVSYLFKKRRVYLKQRRLFRYYQLRLPPYFPFGGGTFVLNNEELATLWHLPGKTVAPAPTVPRVEAKKGEPPSTLPVS